MPDDVVPSPIQEDDTDIFEAWERATPQGDPGWIQAERGDWDEYPWSIFVAAMEYVPLGGPLDAEIYAAMQAALIALPGVTGVGREDREVFTIAGSPPSGPDLVRAGAQVIDAFVDRINLARRDADGPRTD